MRSVVFVLFGIAVLAGLFFVLRPAGSPSPAPVKVTPPSAPEIVPAPSIEPVPAPPEATPAPQTSGEPASRIFDLAVTRGHLASGPSTVALTQGDLVVLRVHSDRDDELHVHGYDLALTLRANETASLAFQADRSGRFDIELHHGGEAIGALEVQPK